MNWRRDFDWDGAIKRNSEALRGIIEALFALLGLDGAETVGQIPHPLHRAVLRVLRPAESAMRRLIVVAARSLVVKVGPSRPMPKGQRIGKMTTRPLCWATTGASTVNPARPSLLDHVLRRV